MATATPPSYVGSIFNPALFSSTAATILQNIICTTLSVGGLLVVSGNAQIAGSLTVGTTNILNAITGNTASIASNTTSIATLVNNILFLGNACTYGIYNASVSFSSVDTTPTIIYTFASSSSTITIPDPSSACVGRRLSIYNASTGTLTITTTSGGLSLRNLTGTDVTTWPVTARGEIKLFGTGSSGNYRWQVCSNASNLLNLGNVSNTEIGYLSGVSSAIQTQLNGKQSTINSSNRLSADLIGTGSVTSTVFGYLANVTSDIQTQLNGKQSTINSSNRLSADLIGTGSVTSTVFGYLANVTSDIQTQLTSFANQAQFLGNSCSISSISANQTYTISTLPTIIYSSSPSTTITIPDAASTNTGRMLRVLNVSSGSMTITTPSASANFRDLTNATVTDWTVTVRGEVKLVSIYTGSFYRWQVVNNTSTDPTITNQIQYLGNSCTSATVTTDTTYTITTLPNFIYITAAPVTVTIPDASATYIGRVLRVFNATSGTITLTTPSASNNFRDLTNTTVTNWSVSIRGEVRIVMVNPSSGVYRWQVINNTSNLLNTGNVTNTELGYLSGVTSSIQGQINTNAANIAAISNTFISVTAVTSNTTVSAGAFARFYLLNTDNVTLTFPDPATVTDGTAFYVYKPNAFSATGINSTVGSAFVVGENVYGASPSTIQTQLNYSCWRFVKIAGQYHRIECSFQAAAGSQSGGLTN